MNEILLQIFCRFLLQYVLFLYETIQTKNVTNCGKSPKGEGVSAKIKNVYISNVDYFETCGDLDFQIFPKCKCRL